MFSKIRRSFRRTRLKVRRWFRDPALDILGVGVISTFVGRTAVFGSFGWAFAVSGLPLQATVFAGMIAVDALIHFEVLVALRRLMRYDIILELTRGQQRPILMAG